ncbi:hypothetical protein [Rufibacter roseus]|uniref:Bacteriophage holin family protein n=1 Tax=Rufibacter roseus TaxID=1567108 RepID=A0ABW2DK80_9BACT|nr:hypothetical protein [Rufibacter roseus]
MSKRFKLFQTLFQNWGFSDAEDYVGTVLGVKAMPYLALLAHFVGALIAGGVAFMAKWVWEPPGAALLIIAMDLLNARYGYLVARKIKGEVFSWKKFHRTFGIIVSDVLLLSMIHHAVQFYPYYAPLSHILFGWLFMHRVGAIVKHMADLKLQDGGLKRFLLKWISNKIRTEVGTQIVDNIQGKEIDTPKKEETL